MKKITILIVVLCGLLGIRAQNSGTTAQPPQGAVLVPGTSDLYVTPYDEVSKMMRNAAVSACGCKGDGWRLPTLGELQIMYSHRYEMDFGDGWYWTGEKVRGEFKFYMLNFKNGKTSESRYDKEGSVRCVWSRNPMPAPASALQPMPQQNNAPVPTGNPQPAPQQNNAPVPTGNPQPAPQQNTQPMQQSGGNNPVGDNRSVSPTNTSSSIVYSQSKKKNV